MLLIPVLKKPPASRALRALAAGLLSFSVGVQLVGSFAYDVRSWNARVSYPVTVPGERGPVIVLEESDASALVANVEGALALEPIRMDVDVLKYRHRLWSIRDNPLIYYATHFSEARARKRRMTEAFISKW